MICPACQNTLTQKTVDGLTVDTCQDGCGGIWFDNFELQKMDASHGHAGEALLDIPRKGSVVLDSSEKRECPCCRGIKMMKHYFSIRHKVVVDECGQCGGIWLDGGELAQIRSLFQDEADRDKATEEYFSAAIKESPKITNIFRFICQIIFPKDRPGTISKSNVKGAAYEKNRLDSSLPVSLSRFGTKPNRP